MILGSLFLTLATLPADSIDTYVEAEMTRQHIPGLTLLVVKDGKTIKEKAYGVSDTDSKRAVKINDRFDMGSIGKTFTATMIMQLVEQGKISLDKPVRDFLPDFPEKWKDITVRHLISHQSGLPDYAFIEGIGLNDTYDSKTWTDKVYKTELDFPTGKLYQYSNTNFVLLGMILEKVTGKKYIDLAKEKLFKPARMDSTGFRVAGKGLPAGSTTGYFYIENKLQDAGPGGVPPVPSDGGGFTTVHDLKNWADGVRSGKIIKPETLKQMQTPSLVASGRKTGYGLGWMTATLEGNPQITHGGNSVGYSGTLSTFPAQKLEIYMLCNLYPVGGDGFAVGLAKLIEPDLVRKPQLSTEDPNPELTAKLLDNLKELSKGNTKAAAFHEDMQLRLATPRGQMVMPAYANFTTASKMEFISSRDEKPDKVFRYRVYDAKTTWIVDFQVTPEGTIYSIGKSPDLDKK